MNWERSDLALGILVIFSIALLGYAAVWSLDRDAEESAYSVDAIFEDATGLQAQGVVELQGYRVGSVRSVLPFRRSDGGVAFRVRLDLTPRVGDELPLRLPAGTRAQLMWRGLPMGPGIVDLQLPARAEGTLAPGAVIPGEHAPTAFDLVQVTAEQLTGELQATLLTSRTLMDTLTRTSATAAATVRSLQAGLEPVLAGLQRELDAAEALTREAHTQLAVVAPAASEGMDSVTVLLGDVNRLVRRLDGMVASHEPRLADIVASLDTTTLVVQHLAERFSRRPLWTLLSGSGEIPRPPADTSQPAPDARPR